MDPNNPKREKTFIDHLIELEIQLVNGPEVIFAVIIVAMVIGLLGFIAIGGCNK